MTYMAKNAAIKRTYSAPAVDMALNVVEFLCEHSGSFGINELSRQLGVPVNSIYRILMRLADRGYVELDPVGGGYHLSSKLISLGMVLHNRLDLGTQARRHLERLSAETGETCQIQVLQGMRMLVLDSIAPGSAFFLRVTPGSLLYAHANAFGKALLAFLSEERLKQIIADGMLALTERSLTSAEDFARELVEVRRTGVAFDHEEYLKGIYCVGAPVFDVQGNVVAGLGVTGLASRNTNPVEFRVHSLTLACAAGVSADLGYRGDRFTMWISAMDIVHNEHGG